MNVVGAPTKSSLANSKGNGEVSTYTASKTLQLYDTAPVTEMSLDQFEIYALKRLKVCQFWGIARRSIPYKSFVAGKSSFLL